MRAVSLASSVAVFALAAFTQGCTVKAASGNGDDRVLRFSTDEAPLAVGVPARMNITSPDQGLHTCVKGCLPIDPNGSFVVDRASCDEDACTVTVNWPDITLIAKREGALKLRVTGHDGNASRTDSFTLSAKRADKLVIVPEVAPMGPALGIVPGLRASFKTEVRDANGALLSHDSRRVEVSAEGAVSVEAPDREGFRDPELVGAAAGKGKVKVVIGPLSSTLEVVVADPDAAYSSLQLFRYEDDEATTVEGALELTSDAGVLHSLVAFDSAGQGYFTGSRYVSTRSGALLSSYGDVTSPTFYLRTSREAPDTFTAAFGGATLSLPVTLAAKKP
jgi:hypothetical protein